MRSLAVRAVCATALSFAVAPSAEAAKASEAFQSGYREVLERLSTGEVDRALDELTRLEKEALGERPSQKTIERIWTAKLRMIRDLIQAESLDVLVPIIVFHHEAAVLYREQREPSLALHSRTMVDELTDFYADRAEGDGKAAVFAGWVLTSLGGYVQEARSFSASRGLFSRALDRDPSNEFAILSLGVSLEMHGRYEEASEYFERLLDLRRDHAEARLRLSLCRRRARVPDSVLYKAVPEMEKVAVDAEAPPWVRSVAFQEIAALHMAGERRAEAEAWLRRGLEVLPDDQSQRIQLAALLERRGQRREAVAVLGAIAPAADTGDSPRRRYDRVPSEGLDEARATMRRMMSSRLPLLSASLGIPAVEASGTESERIGG